MNVRVLLLDNEKAFADVISRRLRKRGLWVSRASGVNEALIVLKEDKIDVVILGTFMQMKHCIDTIRIIKETCPVVEVIVLTPYGTMESAIESVKAGAFDYLTKPADFEKLLESILRPAGKKK